MDLLRRLWPYRSYGFLMSSIAGRGRCLPVVGPSRSCRRISRRRDRWPPSESLRDADRRQDGGHGLLGAAVEGQSFQILQFNCAHLGSQSAGFAIRCCSCAPAMAELITARLTVRQAHGTGAFEYPPPKIENGLVTIKRVSIHAGRVPLSQGRIRPCA